MRIRDWSSDVCSSDLFVSRLSAPQFIRSFSSTATTKATAAATVVPATRHLDRRRNAQSAATAAAVIMKATKGPREADSSNPKQTTAPAARRSAEHTSELQSLMRNSYAVL